MSKKRTKYTSAFKSITGCYAMRLDELGLVDYGGTLTIDKLGFDNSEVAADAFGQYRYYKRRGEGGSKRVASPIYVSFYLLYPFIFFAGL
jgi:hypothetical protein